MTNKNYTLEHAKLQSPINNLGSDCGFAYSPKWFKRNVKRHMKQRQQFNSTYIFPPGLTFENKKES